MNKYIVILLLTITGIIILSIPYCYILTYHITRAMFDVFTQNMEKIHSLYVQKNKKQRSAYSAKK